MQQDLINKNIENIKNASFPQLMLGGFQIFLTRLPVIAFVVSMINLPVAIYYALFRTEFAMPFEIVEATGEVLVNEVLLEQFYNEQMIDMGIGLYTLLAVLAVAFIVELTVHGEIPNINSVVSHAISRWWDGLRTGMVKGLMMIGVFLTVIITGGIMIALFSAILPESVAIFLAVLMMLAIAIIPMMIIVMLFFFDLYASSLREVGGWQALRYSMRINNKKWLKLIKGLVFVFVAIRLPLLIFQLALASFEAMADPVVMIITMLFLNVLSAFSIVVYTLYFLHFDYNTENEKDFKDERSTAKSL